jgi:hypothetical protein
LEQRRSCYIQDEQPIADDRCIKHLNLLREQRPQFESKLQGTRIARPGGQRLRNGRDLNAAFAPDFGDTGALAQVPAASDGHADRCATCDDAESACGQLRCDTCTYRGRVFGSISAINSEEQRRSGGKDSRHLCDEIGKERVGRLRGGYRRHQKREHQTARQRPYMKSAAVVTHCRRF